MMFSLKHSVHLFCSFYSHSPPETQRKTSKVLFDTVLGVHQTKWTFSFSLTPRKRTNSKWLKYDVDHAPPTKPTPLL